MLLAGMREGHGLPPGLGTLKQPWRYSTDLDVLTLPPPLDPSSLCRRAPRGLCGFALCLACTEEAMRQSLGFLAHVDLGAHGIDRIRGGQTPPGNY
jgi:hypothetical protein